MEIFASSLVLIIFLISFLICGIFGYVVGSQKEAVSDFLNRDDTYSIPHGQRHLTALILRKLLASSSHAIANTLETMKSRLELMQEMQKQDPSEADFLEYLIDEEELEDDYLDEILDETTDTEPPEETGIDLQQLNNEINELNRYAQWARSIGVDKVEHCHLEKRCF